MHRRLLLALAGLVLTTAPALAGQTISSYNPPTSTSATPSYGTVAAYDAPIKQPDLISLGAAYADFDKSERIRRGLADFRAEYRWGISLLPLISDYFKSWDSDVQFHPFAGVETNTHGAAYGLGGWSMDWYIDKHWIFTWNEGAGLWYRGDGERMGSVLEFRSQAEGGWRFDNDMRITAEFSHISNAKITRINPGQEIVGLYLHVPTNLIFGK